MDSNISCHEKAAMTEDTLAKLYCEHWIRHENCL